MNTPTVTWSEDGQTRSARWRVDNGTPPPADIQVLYEAADPFTRKVIIDKGANDGVQESAAVTASTLW